MLDCFDFVHGVFLFLAPLELFFEEIEDDEIETPEIISPRQVDVVVSVQACKAHCASEIGCFSLLDWSLTAIEVLLRETEVDNKDLAIILAQNEV